MKEKREQRSVERREESTRKRTGQYSYTRDSECLPVSTARPAEKICWLQLSNESVEKHVELPINFIQ